MGRLMINLQLIVAKITAEFFKILVKMTSVKRKIHVVAKTVLQHLFVALLISTLVC